MYDPMYYRLYYARAVTSSVDPSMRGLVGSKRRSKVVLWWWHILFSTICFLVCGLDRSWFGSCCVRIDKVPTRHVLGLCLKR
jgi:hypothetical protein